MISSVVKLSELYYYLNLNTKSNLSTFSGDGQTFRQIQRIKENFLPWGWRWRWDDKKNWKNNSNHCLSHLVKISLTVVECFKMWAYIQTKLCTDVCGSFQDCTAALINLKFKALLHCKMKTESHKIKHRDEWTNRLENEKLQGTFKIFKKA